MITTYHGPHTHCMGDKGLFTSLAETLAAIYYHLSKCLDVQVSTINVSIRIESPKPSG